MPDRAQAPSLTSWRFDVAACRADLNEFDRLLATKAELAERDDILPFFRTHPNLSAFLGSYHPNINTHDRLGVEVPLFGAFMADVVVGDWARKAYCFVEFEDGKSIGCVSDELGKEVTGRVGLRHDESVHPPIEPSSQRRAALSATSEHSVQDLRRQFETVLESVVSAEAQRVSAEAMERRLLRQVLTLGRGLFALVWS